MTNVKKSEYYKDPSDNYEAAKYGTKLPPVNSSRISETPSGSAGGPVGDNTFLTSGNGTGASVDKF